MSCATSLDLTRTEELLSLAVIAANKFLLTLPTSAQAIVGAYREAKRAA